MDPGTVVIIVASIFSIIMVMVVSLFLHSLKNRVKRNTIDFDKRIKSFWDNIDSIKNFDGGQAELRKIFDDFVEWTPEQVNTYYRLLGYLEGRYTDKKPVDNS